MLQALSIQNIVLINDLHIEFEEGLCVLTGETGAGKSILLDALGLALGGRSEARFLRQGTQRAQVIAVFSLSPLHPCWQELEEQGLSYENHEIIFRRMLESDGKSKCFLNDQVISQGLMRRLGREIVEIHGQFDQLLEPKSHLAALDAFGKIDRFPLSGAFKSYQDAKEKLKTLRETLDKAAERQAFLHFACQEIEKIAPRAGEEIELEAEKALISHRAKIAEALIIVEQNISSGLSSLSQTHKALNRIQSFLPERVTPMLESCDLALVESQEVLEGMKILKGEVEDSPHNLEALENRLYTLRALSRKYQTEDPISYLLEVKKELSALNHPHDQLKEAEDQVKKAKTTFIEMARCFSEKRKETARALEEAMGRELLALKLEQAKFRVHFEERSEEGWGASGIDLIEFYIQTNPGTSEGPLAAIASGGELSRLMLALKVVLAQSGATPTLIFDEIESGTGGAVSSAIGVRLKELSQKMQVLAITHSPQIASHGCQHLRVIKHMSEGETTTHIQNLNQEEQHEEVARMLAGEKITDEARAAAKRLIGDTEWAQAKSL
ncbi:MAG: DNA repair protein RecN [Alphaproteobacteria bacterium]|nr:DNA repair protein RecN [Alphaproteobacteria bacterium]